MKILPFARSGSWINDLSSTNLPFVPVLCVAVEVDQPSDIPCVATQCHVVFRRWYAGRRRERLDSSKTRKSEDKLSPINGICSNETRSPFDRLSFTWISSRSIFLDNTNPPSISCDPHVYCFPFSSAMYTVFCLKQHEEKILVMKIHFSKGKI